MERLMKNGAAYQQWECRFEGKRYRIEEDLPDIGWYLYIFDENDLCLADYLQDSLELAFDFALNQYQVPRNSWIKLHNEHG